VYLNYKTSHNDEQKVIEYIQLVRRTQSLEFVM